ncbi:hypothetical protein JHW43_007859 [Diplocarpon mali]|nr:hypothetical protein JHW43_007859 [Diplocarpon mali]
MGRPQKPARKDPQGIASRQEGQEGPQTPQDSTRTHQRKRKRAPAPESSSTGTAPTGAKRSKPSADPGAGPEHAALPLEDAQCASTARAAPIHAGLASTHEVATMSVVSSSRMQKKVARALQVLRADAGEGVPAPAGERRRGRVVMLYAKAPVVAKMISVAEIVKREVAKVGGQWFQYCVVGDVLEDRKEKGKGKGKEKGKGKGKAEGDMGREEGEEGEEGEEEEEGEEGFETMKTPFERANEGRPKVRAVPNMCLYLSSARIEGLRAAYG